MTLVEKIMNLYAELKIEDFANLITVQDDGNGQFIAKWEHPTLAKPTDEELA